MKINHISKKDEFARKYIEASNNAHYKDLSKYVAERTVLHEAKLSGVDPAIVLGRVFAIYTRKKGIYI